MLNGVIRHDKMPGWQMPVGRIAAIEEWGHVRGEHLLPRPLHCTGENKCPILASASAFHCRFYAE